MFNPTLIQKIIHTWEVKTRKIRAKHKRKKLKKTDFTIISNNFWWGGGIAYEEFNIPKQSPTVGLYFFADDYIKFLSRFEYYIGLELKFIDIDDSKYKDTYFGNRYFDVVSFLNG